MPVNGLRALAITGLVCLAVASVATAPVTLAAAVAAAGIAAAVIPDTRRPLQDRWADTRDSLPEPVRRVATAAVEPVRWVGRWRRGRVTPAGETADFRAEVGRSWGGLFHTWQIRRKADDQVVAFMGGRDGRAAAASHAAQVLAELQEEADWEPERRPRRRREHTREADEAAARVGAWLRDDRARRERGDRPRRRAIDWGTPCPECGDALGWRPLTCATCRQANGVTADAPADVPGPVLADVIVDRLTPAVDDAEERPERCAGCGGFLGWHPTTCPVCRDEAARLAAEARAQAAAEPDPYLRGRLEARAALHQANATTGGSDRPEQLEESEEMARTRSDVPADEPAFEPARGWRYRGEVIPDHQLVDRLIADGLAAPAARDQPVTDVVDQVVDANAVDWADPADRHTFPHRPDHSTDSTSSTDGSTSTDHDSNAIREAVLMATTNNDSSSGAGGRDGLGTAGRASISGLVIDWESSVEARQHPETFMAWLQAQAAAARQRAQMVPELVDGYHGRGPSGHAGVPEQQITAFSQRYAESAAAEADAYERWAAEYAAYWEHARQEMTASYGKEVIRDAANTHTG